MTNKQVIQKFTKDLFSPFAPSSIKPVSNFYNYINYLWLKNTNLTNNQKYITQIDNFRIVQDKVYEQLKEIVEEYIKNNNNRTSRNLNNYYKSLLQFNPKQTSIKQAKEYTILVDELGHHWPGGKGTLNKRLAGKPSNKVHASSEIWSFLNG